MLKFFQTRKNIRIKAEAGKKKYESCSPIQGKGENKSAYQAKPEKK